MVKSHRGELTDHESEIKYLLNSLIKRSIATRAVWHALQKPIVMKSRFCIWHNISRQRSPITVTLRFAESLKMYSSMMPPPQSFQLILTPKSIILLICTHWAKNDLHRLMGEAGHKLSKKSHFTSRGSISISIFDSRFNHHGRIVNTLILYSYIWAIIWPEKAGSNANHKYQFRDNFVLKLL